VFRIFHHRVAFRVFFFETIAEDCTQKEDRQGGMAALSLNLPSRGGALPESSFSLSHQDERELPVNERQLEPRQEHDALSEATCPLPER